MKAALSEEDLREPGRLPAGGSGGQGPHGAGAGTWGNPMVMGCRGAEVDGIAVFTPAPGLLPGGRHANLGTGGPN
jgi:hypothetical protein